jgi:hypothetical protein
MAHGFFTVEQWKAPRKGAKPEWIPVLWLDAGESLSKAAAALEKRGEPGLFRVVQMQRCIWAEMDKGGKLRLHGSHASTPQSLDEIVRIYECEDGRRPIDKARRDRAEAKAKAKRGKK